MESVLIIGAAGFVGKEVSRVCRSQNLTTIGVDICQPEDITLFSKFHLVNQGEPHIEAILLENKPTYLLNLAGNAEVGRSVREPRFDFELSVNLFSALLDQVRQCSPETRVLFVSSAAVYGQPRVLPILETMAPQPISPYGYHKWMCELLTQEYRSVYGVSVASVRVFSAYGVGLRKQILWDLCNKCAVGGQILLGGDGTESRDFIYVSDIARAILCVLRNAAFAGEIVNIASGQETTISELAAVVIEQFGIPRSRLAFSGQERPGDPKNWRADISRLSTMGFVPSIELEDGVGRYVNWFKGL